MPIVEEEGSMSDPLGTDLRDKGAGRNACPPPPSFVRLTVNVEAETMRTLQWLAEANRLSLTDGIGRAVTLWEFLTERVARGDRIALINPGGTMQTLDMR
ncbi:hypothetical protein [Nonomuraea sp. NPDC048826]|uniref:hypothetical protein n=1 Tax=Nonomuraea sp. NPDC048826 TaxID=3364347 RepID=UPI00371F9E9C